VSGASLSILVTIIVGILGIIAAIAKGQTWLLARLKESQDERVQTHLKPLMVMLQKLDGEPGDDDRGIPARPGILQRQTATERQAVKIAERTEVLETNQRQLMDQVSELRAVVDRISAQFDRNGGSSMRDAMDATRSAAETVANGYVRVDVPHPA
jgi:uncharacterized protein YukE